MNYVSITFNWEAKQSRNYTYKCKGTYTRGDKLIVGDKRDMSVVEVLAMTDKPPFECKVILGKLQAE